jgi:large subunit ribosomal protein L13e
MTKGNNAIPHVHQRKHFNPNASQKGNIKTFLAQPKRKETRRRLRLQKAKKVFPRPLKALRPTVACPTVRYNMKKRLGRGFTLSELAAAGIKSSKYAATIGIKVDARRRNQSQESLETNTQKLKTYMSKLVVFPHGKKAKKEEQKKAQQVVVASVVPTTVKATLEAPRKVSKEETQKSAYAFLKKNLSAARFLGARIARAAKKAAEAAKKEGKQ